jgi:hypothetical protein
MPKHSRHLTVPSSVIRIAFSRELHDMFFHDTFDSTKACELAMVQLFRGSHQYSNV